MDTTTTTTPPTLHEGDSVDIVRGKLFGRKGKILTVSECGRYLKVRVSFFPKDEEWLMCAWEVQATGRQP
jgi:transcription antitermination factor NusG